MESESAAKSVETAAQKSERSTIEFPYNDLDNAFDIVKGVHEVQGTACSYEQLAAHLKQEPKGGGFRVRISGTTHYGLITYERGGRIALTDLAKRILEPESEKEARRDAFLNVPLFRKVYEEFKGRQLPPQAGLERALQSFGVGEKVKDKARQIMMRAAKQAGFFDLSSDRLTMPAIKSEQSRKPQEETESKDNVAPPNGNGKNSNGTGASGGGGGQFHPFIQGLLQELPPPGSSWSAQKRADWLNTANSIFKMIFESPDGDVTIQIETTGRKGDTAR